MKRAKKCGFDSTSTDTVKANRHLEKLYFEDLYKRLEKLYCVFQNDEDEIIKQKIYYGNTQ